MSPLLDRLPSRTGKGLVNIIVDTPKGSRKYEPIARTGGLRASAPV